MCFPSRSPRETRACGTILSWSIRVDGGRPLREETTSCRLLRKPSRPAGFLPAGSPLQGAVPQLIRPQPNRPNPRILPYSHGWNARSAVLFPQTMPESVRVYRPNDRPRPHFTLPNAHHLHCAASPYIPHHTTTTAISASLRRDPGFPTLSDKSHTPTGKSAAFEGKSEFSGRELLPVSTPFGSVLQRGRMPGATWSRLPLRRISLGRREGRALPLGWLRFLDEGQA